MVAVSSNKSREVLKAVLDVFARFPVHFDGHGGDFFDESFFRVFRGAVRYLKSLALKYRPKNNHASRNSLAVSRQNIPCIAGFSGLHKGDFFIFRRYLYYFSFDG